MDIGRKLNVHKTFRRRPGHLRYVQFTSCVKGITMWNVQSYLKKGARTSHNFAIFLLTLKNYFLVIKYLLKVNVVVLVSLLSTYFTFFSSIFIVDSEHVNFGQVNVSWRTIMVRLEWHYYIIFIMEIWTGSIFAVFTTF